MKPISKNKKKLPAPKKKPVAKKAPPVLKKKIPQTPAPKPKAVIPPPPPKREETAPLVVTGEIKRKSSPTNSMPLHPDPVLIQLEQIDPKLMPKAGEVYDVDFRPNGFVARVLIAEIDPNGYIWFASSAKFEGKFRYRGYVRVEPAYWRDNYVGKNVKRVASID